MKYFIILMFLLFVSHLGFSQEKESYNNLVSGKWQIQSIEIEDDVMNIANEGHWMVFHANGYYQIMLDKDEQVGTWSLKEEDKINFDTRHYDGESDINKLNNGELKFSIEGYTVALVK